MKSSFISALFFGAAIAVPANHAKRSLVLVEEIVTQWTTVTVYAGHKATGTASKKQAAFFEFPSSFTVSKPTASVEIPLASSSIPAVVIPTPPPVLAVVPSIVSEVPKVVASAIAPIAAIAAPPATGGGPSGTGEITFYSLGTVSCGQTYGDGDAVVALSTLVMTKFQGNNPNNNSLCGKTIHVTLNGKTVSGKVVDTCMGCAANNVDLSPSLFSQLADFGAGRVDGATWSVDM